MTWHFPRYRLSTLMIIVTVASILLGLNTAPSVVMGNGVNEWMTFNVDYGCPATCLSREWVARYDRPPTMQIPSNALWCIYPLGLLINIGFGACVAYVLSVAWNRFSLGTLWFGMFVASTLMAVNAHFMRTSPITFRGTMYDYSHGWPEPSQSGPAPTPVIVHPDGTEEQGAYGYIEFNRSARLVNLIIASTVVVISCFAFAVCRRTIALIRCIQWPLA